MTAIIESPDELSTAWLGDALGREVNAYEVSPVGTGQMGSCHRITLRGDASLPASVLLKLPSSDAGTRQMVAGAYRGEIRFYTELLTAFPDIHFDLDYIVIGPQGLGLAQEDPLIEFLSNLGLAFLFFLAGMELDFNRIRGRPPPG